LLAAGCGSGDEPEPAGQTTTTAREELPPAVAEKHEAIVDAAHALDYDTLRTLLDPKTFSYSFGEKGDPVGYWRRQEEEGEVPILGDYLPVVLGTPFAKVDDVYVWPRAYAKEPEDWTAEDRESLTNLYSPEEIKQFERAGSYLGWRAGIREDGTWLFFVSGD
jgi:predicted lipid-binding transport protein (Tim44 family)